MLHCKSKYQLFLSESKITINVINTNYKITEYIIYTIYRLLYNIEACSTSRFIIYLL